MNVLILKQYSDDIYKIIRDCFPPDWEVSAVSALLPVENTELMKKLKNADILIPEHFEITADIISQCGKLKIIQTGAGFNNIDLAAAYEKGITVANASGMNSSEVAEHVFALLLAWYKKIIYLDREIRSGNWTELSHLKPDGKALDNMTLGIAGYGNIGRRTAEIAAAFGMKILVYTRKQSEPDKNKHIIQTDLDTLLRESDAVTIHLPLTDSTRHFIGKNELKKMKNNAFLINTSQIGRASCRERV